VPSSHEEQSRYHQAPVSYRSSQEPSGGHPHTLSVTVPFTTVSGTINALRKAEQLVYQLEACIQIFIAHVVPYPLPIDKPCVDPEFRLSQFRAFCEQAPVETRIDIQLCRDYQECIKDALRPHSLIVIGGCRSWWPMTFEKRLAGNLKRAGHQVVFVDDRALRP
jgi:hypothetical protein